MSDLQCAVRVFLARHGEAEYESALVTDDGGSLTHLGRGQARDLGERLRAERIARVYTSPMSRAVQTAEIAAGVLAVDVAVREGLREHGVGVLDGSTCDEAMTEIADRVTRVLDEIADLHRGETVLVVGHGGALLATVARLPGHPAAPAGALAWEPCAVMELAGDADGWRSVDERHGGEVRAP